MEEPLYSAIYPYSSTPNLVIADTPPHADKLKSPTVFIQLETSTNADIQYTIYCLTNYQGLHLLCFALALKL